MEDEKEYDVVVDVLQKHIDKLWDMTKGNEQWGMMDHIRMDQIAEMRTAIVLWSKHKEINHGTK